MHQPARPEPSRHRPAPHRGRRAPAFPLLTALLLALLAVLAPGDPRALPFPHPHAFPQSAPAGVAAAGPVAAHGTVPHAGDPCAAGCLTPTAVRPQLPVDHPPHPGQPAVPPTGTAPAPPALARAGVRPADRLPAPAEALPHRGRSPPSGV
ncbi:hypothetical protein [Streptomyces fragilis]|uniref:Secreted protein n=1 Tax=Streptomyces fragilis TaxID=67301 RepID=A0ABV2YDM1_9ACTN|nr:hypothetical protein [Streptomyces fragilis]